VIAGEREVTIDFEVYAADDEQTKALYEASRHRSPIRALFQLGQTTGQMFGVYLKSVVPELPAFNDGDLRLSWGFTECRAQGSGDDELVVAFG
jgi:hypothetical protein